MNTLVIVASLLIATTYGTPLNKEQVKEAAAKLIKECREKEGASDADVQALKDKKMPETKEGLCMLGCVFETTQIMKDGKFTKDGMIEAFKPHLQAGSDKLTKLNGLAETCEKEMANTGSDKCENAKLLVECMVKNAPSHGIELPTEV